MHPTNIEARRTIALERLIAPQLERLNAEDRIEEALTRGLYKCGKCGRNVAGFERRVWRLSLRATATIGQTGDWLSTPTCCLPIRCGTGKHV